MLGSVVLFGLMQLIKDSMSAGVVGRKIVSSVIWPRWCENSFLALTIFSLSLAATLVKKVLKWFAIRLVFGVIVSPVSNCLLADYFWFFYNFFIVSHMVSKSFLFSFKWVL